MNGAGAPAGGAREPTRSVTRAACRGPVGAPLAAARLAPAGSSNPSMTTCTPGARAVPAAGWSGPAPSAIDTHGSACAPDCARARMSSSRDLPGMPARGSTASSPLRSELREALSCNSVARRASSSRQQGTLRWSRFSTRAMSARPSAARRTLVSEMQSDERGFSVSNAWSVLLRRRTAKSVVRGGTQCYGADPPQLAPRCQGSPRTESQTCEGIRGPAPPPAGAPQPWRV